MPKQVARGLVALGAVAAQPLAFAAGEPGASPWRELPSVGMSLVLVLLAIGAVAWLARRSPLVAGARSKGPLKVLATLALGPKERIVLIEAGEAKLLVGVSPAGIFPLQSAAVGALAKDSSALGFSELLQKVK